MKKLEVLKDLRIGERVAEEESHDLEKYFVETDQWQQLYNGEIDVVYGAKGTGKSALYTLLNSKEGELFDEGILITAAENVRGATVFRALTIDPPPSEISFIFLWKIYFLLIIARSLRDYEIKNGHTDELVRALEKTTLLPAEDTIKAIFLAVTRYFKGWLDRDTSSVEYGISVDPITGVPTATRKTEFREGSDAQNLEDFPIDDLYDIANNGLDEAGIVVWILLDRLDVAFADSPAVEKNALRALFRTYNDLKVYENISIKIFVRDDIWRRITEGGFTEASHITRTTDIRWDEASLLNVAMLRIINSDKLLNFYNVKAEEIRKDYDKQVALFYDMFPEKVESGRNPETFRWIVSRTVDATGNSAPRELIHFLEAVRDLQIRRLERGEDEPNGSQLFERSVFKEALTMVSKARYEQTLIAENPTFKPHLERLDGEKAEQTVKSLATLWQLSESEASNIAKGLAEIGFFEIRGSGEEITYWVPFLYRSALNLIQGKSL